MNNTSLKDSIKVLEKCLESIRETAEPSVIQEIESSIKELEIELKSNSNPDKGKLVKVFLEIFGKIATYIPVVIKIIDSLRDE